MSDSPPEPSPDLTTSVAASDKTEPPTSTTAADETVSSVADRIIYALRLAGLLAVALLVAGLVTDRLRPPEALDRGIASTPFLWAIIVWLVVLLFHAIAFEQSQMKALESTPLFAALGVGAFILLTGLISFGDGDIGRRIIYLFANALGAVMFWWGLFGLVFLVIARLKV